MFFTGRFVRSLDEKHRLAIPKSLRDSLGKQAERPLFVAPGLDGALAIYPEEGFARLVDRLQTGPPTASEVRDYSRLFFSQAASARIDSQGRLRLPMELVSWAKLENEVVLLGVQDRMEIWRPDVWAAYVNERQERYDQIAEAAFGQAAPPTK